MLLTFVFKPFDGCDFCHQGLGVIDIVFIVMEDYSGLSHLVGSSKSTYDTENLKSLDHVSKTDTEKKKLLNKVFIFAFFVHKKYSRSFTKLRSNH